MGTWGTCCAADAIVGTRTGGLWVVLMDLLTSQETASTHLSSLVSQMRISLGIQLEAIPPYMHHLNPYAEGLMRILKVGCVRRLPALVGKRIYSETITEPREFWPWAMEHKVQSYNLQPNSMVERDSGEITTPLAEFDSKTSDDVVNNLQPFGSNVIVIMQPNQRRSAMDSPTWRATYLFSGSMNPFTHIYANAPRAHVVVKETGQLQITGRAIFPDANVLPVSARQDIVLDPTAKHDAPDERAFTPAGIGQSRAHRPHSQAPLPSTARVFDSRVLVGPNASSTSPPDGAAPKASPFASLGDLPPSDGESSADDARVALPSEPSHDSHVSERGSPARPPGSPAHPAATDGSAVPSPVGPSPATTSPTAATPKPLQSPPPGARPTRLPTASRFTATPTRLLSPQPGTARASSGALAPQPVLEPMRIPPPDQLRNNTEITFRIVGDKHGKSKLRFDLYRHATTPAGYFSAHPGPTDAMGRVTANADWKNDVKHGLVVFDKHEYRDLAAHYEMQGEELETFFAMHPFELAKSRARAKRNVLRCFAMTVGDELDLLPDEVQYIQESQSLDVPKSQRAYFNNTDVDETVLDSAIYHVIMNTETPVDEIYLSVEYDKNRSTHRRARDDPTYKPKPEDLTVDEHLLKDLKGIVDPVERARMVKAIIKEISDLCAIGTFELVRVPLDRKPVPSRLVLKVKYLADGTYNKHKARLVAKGFMQRLGVDFFSVFSPMATLTTVRVLFALAVSQGHDIFHADIPQAFVQSILDVDVWMSLPDGVTVKGPDGSENKVVKLIRSLYGLRNAPQLWNKALTSFFINTMGYTQASSDGCLFYKLTARGYVLVACEVDDLVITGSDSEGMKELRSELTSKYKITEWGPISSFLGINMAYKNGVLEMDVIEKIRELFKKHGILNSNNYIAQRDTPLDDDYSKISVEPSDMLKTISEYSPVEKYIEEHFPSIVGALIYISITARPDIAFAIGKLSRGMHKPNPRHVRMLQHTLGYLRKTQNLKFVYKQTGNCIEMLFRDIGKRDVALATLSASDQQNIDPLGGFSDANFANKSDEQCKSISGYCFYLFGCCVSWRSKLQTITAASTFESELIALAFAGNEAVWIRKLLTELKFALPENINLRDLDVAENKELTKEIEPVSVIDFDRHGDDVPDAETSRSDMAPTPILADNKSVEFSVNNPETSQRTRHLDARYFKIRDYIRSLFIRVRHIGTDVNVADFFTKALPRVQFRRYRNYLGMEGDI